MSSSGTSAADTDTSSNIGIGLKRSPPSLSQSPTQAKKLRSENSWGGDPALENNRNEDDESLISSPKLDSDINNTNNTNNTNSNNNISNNTNSGNNNSKVSLPSIFTTFEDPFRNPEQRRSSAPSVASTAGNNRPSPYPRRNTNNNANNNSHAHASNIQSSLSTYQFPPSSTSPPIPTTDNGDNNNSNNNKRPRLSADTQFGISNASNTTATTATSSGSPAYADQPSSSSTYSTGPGTGTTPGTTPASSSAASSFPLSAAFSPLPSDYLSRPHHHNGLSNHHHHHHYIDNTDNNNNNNNNSWSSSAIGSGIIRPSSTPGQLPTSSSSGSPMIKYEDSSMRHSSFSAAQLPQMYGGAARISGHRLGGGGVPGGINVSMKQDHEWSFPSSSGTGTGSHQDYVLPPNNNNSYSSPGISHTQQPFISVGSSPSLSSHRSSQQSPSLSSSLPPSQSQSGALVGGLTDRPPRKRGKLPKETTDYLKAWLHRHSDHPYPSEDEKKQLCHATGLSMSQVSNWMINVSFFCLI